MSAIIQPLSLALVQLYPVEGPLGRGYLWVLFHEGIAIDHIDEGLGKAKAGSPATGLDWSWCVFFVVGFFYVGCLAGPGTGGPSG